MSSPTSTPPTGLRLALLLLAVLGGLTVGGCELGEVTVAEPEQVMVAEVWLRSEPAGNTGVALIYRTPGPDRGALEGGGVRVLDPVGGEVAEFSEQPGPVECVEGRLPSEVESLCFTLVATEPGAGLLAPGRTLRVEVDLPDGGFLDGTTRMPGDFELVSPRPRPIPCSLPSGTVLPVRWTPSTGVWAYVPEAQIFGLEDLFSDRGISVPTDPVTLLGLSISEADTTIAFPSEFGLFNRFSGDRDLLVAIQQGIPEGSPVDGQVVVAAQDRNATNWLRGGSFNPSGSVRVPSLFGDGTGVAGAVVVRGFTFRVDDPQAPSCIE